MFEQVYDEKEWDHLSSNDLLNMKLKTAQMHIFCAHEWRHTVSLKVDCLKLCVFLCVFLYKHISCYVSLYQVNHAKLKEKD